MKEDGVELPWVAPRAPLPAGEVNYVTPSGLAALHDERARLLASRPDPEAADGPTALSAFHARLNALEARITSAIVPDAAALPRDEVRFSATVTLRAEDGHQRRYRIVGVDEADAASGSIAFTAPLARELTGKRVGDVVSLRQPRGETELEIIRIDYT